MVDINSVYTSLGVILVDDLKRTSIKEISVDNVSEKIALCELFREEIQYFIKFVEDYSALENDFTFLAEIERRIIGDVTGASELIFKEHCVNMLNRAEAQRRLTSLLSSSSAFRERAMHRIKKRHGKNSPEFMGFTEKLSLIYDSSFSYRLMYNLRNYAQHEGAPISLTDLSAIMKSGRDYEVTAKIQLNAVHLKNSDLVQKSFKKELEKHQVSELNIIELSALFIADMAQLMQFLLISYMPKLRNLSSEITNLYGDVVLSSNSNLVLMRTEKTSGGRTVNVAYLLTEIMPYLEELALEFSDARGHVDDLLKHIRIKP